MRPYLGQPHQQRGAVLITAVFFSVLVATIAWNLVFEQTLMQRRYGAMLIGEQALQYALGGEAWVKDILRQDGEDSDNDNLTEGWATDIPPLPIDGGLIMGALEDLQGRFNLNNLVNANGDVDKGSEEIFRRLLRVLELDEELATAVIDWLDSDTTTSYPGGAEDDVYTGNTPSYRAANMLITDVSELRAIAGFDAVAYALVQPHVVALPPGKQLNVNTLSDAVYRALSDEHDPLALEDYLAEREEAPYEDLLGADANRWQRDISPQVRAWLGTRSQFFGLSVLVQLGDKQMALYSVLERDQANLVQPRLRTWLSIPE